MTEKERIQGEIKMLQSKLSFLEELEKHKKTPAEEAFKEVYGHYPLPVIEGISSPTWTAFQKGYEAAQAKDAGEYQPKPPTLYDALHLPYRTVGYLLNEGQKGWICDKVRGWLIDHTVIETEDAETVTLTIHKEQLQTPK